MTRITSVSLIVFLTLGVGCERKGIGVAQVTVRVQMDVGSDTELGAFPISVQLDPDFPAVHGSIPKNGYAELVANAYVYTKDSPFGSSRELPFANIVVQTTATYCDDQRIQIVEERYESTPKPTCILKCKLMGCEDSRGGTD